MLITKLTLKNFRSFGESGESVTLNNLSGFVGSNSSGKTALVQSLVKMFGISTHDRALEKSDFHISNNSVIEDHNELQLSIEVRIDFPELNDTKDNQSKSTIPPFFSQLIINSAGEYPYLRIRLIGKWIADHTPEGDIEQKLYFITVAEDTEEKEEDIIPVTSHQRSVIQVMYVPAVREPSSQLRHASGSILWRILKSISWPEDIDNTIKTKMEPIDELFSSIDGVNKIKNLIGEEWRKYHKDIRYQDAKLQFSNSTLSSLLKKIEVSFSPTHDFGEYNVEKLGDGLRSLFYLSLVSSLLTIELEMLEKPVAALTLLIVEEPENHISPQLLGRIMDNFKKISQKENAQVMLTSHSSSIVKRIHPEDLSYLRIRQVEYTTVVKKIVLPNKESNAYMYIKEAVTAYPELYFARLVILGEGDSEQIVIPRILEVNEIFPDDYGICIVPLGGKHVNHMWKLLNELDIPHITLLDLDRERGTGGWSRIHYTIIQLLANGKRREDLLKMVQENNQVERILTDQEVDDFHGKLMDERGLENMNAWIRHLKNEEYNVFFSAPLDLDFLMLETFTEAYKKTVPRGPSIPDKIEKLEEYNKKVKGGIIAALKNENAIAHTYSEEQQELMIWYNTLFLGRSKPSTHIEALLNIPDKELMHNIPDNFKEFVERVKNLVERDG